MTIEETVSGTNKAVDALAPHIEPIIMTGINMTNGSRMEARVFLRRWEKYLSARRMVSSEREGVCL